MTAVYRFHLQQPYEVVEVFAPTVAEAWIRLYNARPDAIVESVAERPCHLESTLLSGLLGVERPGR